MAKKNVTPTKSNLTQLKEELKLAKDGHGLLEQKREVLIVNLTNLLASIREKRQALDETFSQIFIQLSLAKIETVDLDLIVDHVKSDFEAEILPYSVMGVAVPKLVFIEQRTKNQSIVPMGLSGTNPTFDKLITMVRSIRPLFSEVAWLESTAWKLANEVKKTQRRINALENFVIPDTNDTMKFIGDILEEKDRETLFQIKRVKEKARKKQALKKEGIHEL